MSTKNTLYTFQGLFLYTKVDSDVGKIRGEMNPDRKGYFKDGKLGCESLTHKIVGHIQCSDYTTRMLFCLLTGKTVNSFYELTNDARVKQWVKDFSGLYIGKVYSNKASGNISLDVIKDFSRLEQYVFDNGRLLGSVQLELNKVPSQVKEAILLSPKPF